MPKGVKGVRIRIDFLPGKRSTHKYEVYLMDAISGRSGTVESFETRKQAQHYIKTHLAPEIRERAKMKREQKKKLEKRR